MSRILTSLCPACGAQVRFTGDSTVIAVCEYCSSTLLRKGQALENLGRMAELFDQPDDTPPDLEIDDMPTLYEKNMKRIYQQKQREARAQMLIRLLTTRFGPLPDAIGARIQAGTEADHDRWADQLLTAPSLEAVFSDGPLTAH